MLLEVGNQPAGYQWTFGEKEPVRGTQQIPHCLCKGRLLTLPALVIPDVMRSPHTWRWTPSSICFTLYLLFVVYLFVSKFHLAPARPNPIGGNTEFSLETFHIQNIENKHGHPTRGHIPNCSSSTSVLPVQSNKAYPLFGVCLYLEEAIPPSIRGCWLRLNGVAGNGVLGCKTGMSKFNKAITAKPDFDDPKVVFGPNGAPLLIYTEKTQEWNVFHKAKYWIIDLRSAFGTLGSFSQKLWERVPYQYQHTVEVKNDVQIKHWNTFVDGDHLLFADHLSGSKFHLLNPKHPSLVPISDKTPDNCLKTLLGDSLWNMCGVTNSLRVSFCTTAQHCPLTLHNTVYFATFYLCRERPSFKEHFVITWNITYPYRYISLSSPFNLIGTSDEATFESASMFYAHSQVVPPSQLDRGFLDTKVAFTEAKGEDFVYTQALAATFLDHHTRCPA